MQSSGGCDGERSYQVLSCEVRASDEVASICQEGEERPNKRPKLAGQKARDTWARAKLTRPSTSFKGMYAEQVPVTTPSRLRPQLAFHDELLVVVALGQGPLSHSPAASSGAPAAPPSRLSRRLRR